MNKSNIPSWVRWDNPRTCEGGWEIVTQNGDVVLINLSLDDGCGWLDDQDEAGRAMKDAAETVFKEEEEELVECYARSWLGKVYRGILRKIVRFDYAAEAIEAVGA